MKSRVALGAIIFASVAFVVAAWSSAAGAQTGTFTSSPSSGPPGTTISVQSVTPCMPPASSPGGGPFIRLALQRGSVTLGTAQIPLGSGGSWSGSITVSSSASAGTAQLTAFCIAGPQAEGAVLEYTPHTFTVSGGGALARTGGSPWRATTVGTALVLVGFACWRGRRRPSNWRG
jgi:hypothetical protein